MTAPLELPTTLDAAVGRPGELRAGGTDLSERRHLRLSQGTVVDLRDVAGLDTIEWREDALHVGALVTLADLAAHPDVRRHYPAVAAAAGNLATPQIRNRATLGGNLLQHVRCWYYRRPGADCLRAGGNVCHARGGDHLFHVCHDTGPCIAPHPSTMATALLAHDVRLDIAGDRPRTLPELYGDLEGGRRHHVLPAGAVLRSVSLGPARAQERAAYVRATSRQRAEWPLVEAVARLVLDGGALTSVALTLGAVANLPLRLGDAEKRLQGQPPSAEAFTAAAELAVAGMRALPGTAYKHEIARGLVVEVLERALAHEPAPAR